MVSCGLDDSRIFPKKLSESKYTFYYIPEQPVILQLENQVVMPEPCPDNDTIGGSQVYYMVNELDHSDVIIDVELGDSSELHDGAYIFMMH